MRFRCGRSAAFAEIGFVADAPIKANFAKRVPTGSRPFRRWFRNWVTEKEGFRERDDQLEQCQRGPADAFRTRLIAFSGAQAKGLARTSAESEHLRSDIPSTLCPGIKSWATAASWSASPGVGFPVNPTLADTWAGSHGFLLWVPCSSPALRCPNGVT